MVENKENHWYQEVAIRKARFFAFHGFYPEEQILGNEFWVSVKLRFLPLDPESGLFVNYEQLYQLVRSAMQRTQKLLESVLEDIARSIQQTFPFVESIQVEIRKSTPPFGGDQAEAVVTLTHGVW